MSLYRCHASATAGRLWRIPEHASLSRFTVRGLLLNGRHDARRLRKREGKPGRRLIDLPARTGTSPVLREGPVPIRRFRTSLGLPHRFDVRRSAASAFPGGLDGRAARPSEPSHGQAISTIEKPNGQSSCPKPERCHPERPADRHMDARHTMPTHFSVEFPSFPL